MHVNGMVTLLGTVNKKLRFTQKRKVRQGPAPACRTGNKYSSHQLANHSEPSNTRELVKNEIKEFNCEITDTREKQNVQIADILCEACRANEITFAVTVGRKPYQFLVDNGAMISTIKKGISQKAIRSSSLEARSAPGNKLKIWRAKS